MPKTWLSWLPALGQGADAQWWIHGFFYSREGTLSSGIDMAPMLDFEKRRVIVSELFAEFPRLGFPPPKNRPGGVRNNTSQVMKPESVCEWNENDLPEEEKVEAAVKRVLDDRYGWFEMLAPILKPLCLRVASEK